MLWTDNMIIPLHAANPLDAMTCMDYFYSPITQSVVEYYNDYICPVPDAKQQFSTRPAGTRPHSRRCTRRFNFQPSVTADSLTYSPPPPE